jgi:hypothetical protein
VFAVDVCILLPSLYTVNYFVKKNTHLFEIDKYRLCEYNNTSTTGGKMDTIKFTNDLAETVRMIEANAPALDIAKAAGYKNSQELAVSVGLSHQNTLSSWKKEKPKKYASTVLGAAVLIRLAKPR